MQGRGWLVVAARGVSVWAGGLRGIGRLACQSVHCTSEAQLGHGPAPRTHALHGQRGRCCSWAGATPSSSKVWHWRAANAWSNQKTWNPRLPTARGAGLLLLLAHLEGVSGMSSRERRSPQPVAARAKPMSATSRLAARGPTTCAGSAGGGGQHMACGAQKACPVQPAPLRDCLLIARST